MIAVPDAISCGSPRARAHASCGPPARAGKVAIETMSPEPAAHAGFGVTQFCWLTSPPVLDLGERVRHGQRPLGQAHGLLTWKSGRVMLCGWVFFLLSLGSPHVRRMGRTCGEPNEIELTLHRGGVERLTPRTSLAGTGAHTSVRASAGGMLRSL